MRPAPIEKAELFAVALRYFGGIEAIMKWSKEDRQAFLDFFNLPTEKEDVPHKENK